MNNPNNNIPAFPLSVDVDESKPNSYLQMGMTLKDYYAGQALMGFISKGLSIENAVQYSWITAETMISQREKINNKI